MKQFALSLLLFFVSAQFVYAADIVVLGLFKNKAIVQIDGKQHTLKKGKNIIKDKFKEDYEDFKNGDYDLI